MKRVWDTITKNGAIEVVETHQEDRGATGTFGDIAFVITYKDGSKISGKETISYLNGRWTHGIHDLYELVLANEPENPSDMIPLSRDFKTVEGTGVSLRVPEGCVFDSIQREFDHPRLGILIGVDYEHGRTFAHVLDFAKQVWASPGTELSRKQQIKGDSRWEYLLFEGVRKDQRGVKWTYLTLAIGDASQAVMVSALAPSGDAKAKLIRQSLLSTKWDPESPDTLLRRLDFDVTPTEGFVLQGVHLALRAIHFTAGHQDEADLEPATATRFAAIKSPLLFPDEDIKDAFDRLIARTPSRFTQPVVEKSEPLKIGEFQGIEATGTIRRSADDGLMFRYTAVLRVTEAMYWFEGVTPVEQRREYEDQFRAMTRSFKRRMTVER